MITIVLKPIKFLIKAPIWIETSTLASCLVSFQIDCILPTTISFLFTGLFFIALGTGGIKPCVPSLGGDQFALPQQERLLAQFFSIFFFSVNLGSLLSTIITPILRENVHCFGEDSCFPFAFGLPSVLMISAISN